MADSLTEEQAEELVRGFAESKMTIPNFFNNVVKTTDSTKVGNLTDDELGKSKLPVRTYKELALFSTDVANETNWGNYFTKMAEIQNATSLSRGALLLRLAVTIKKELADTTKERKANRGWFKKKESTETGGV